jgi:hypothetical protein
MYPRMKHAEYPTFDKLNPSNQLNETTSNHHLYPEFIRDTQKSSQKPNRSRTIRNKKNKHKIKSHKLA